MNSPIRGRASKVQQLPVEIKEQLDAWLRDPRVSQLEILNQVNCALAEAGLHTEQISRSGLSRYALAMESVGARIRQAREVSQQWIAKLGEAPEGEVSHILIEVVRTLAFDTALNASNGGAPMEPKLIRDLATGIAQLERAASDSQRREDAIRKAALAEAAEKAAKSATERGLSADTVAEIKAQILGV